MFFRRVRFVSLMLFPFSIASCKSPQAYQNKVVILDTGFGEWVKIYTFRSELVIDINSKKYTTDLGLFVAALLSNLRPEENDLLFHALDLKSDELKVLEESARANHARATVIKDLLELLSRQSRQLSTEATSRLMALVEQVRKDQKELLSEKETLIKEIQNLKSKDLSNQDSIVSETLQRGIASFRQHLGDFTKDQILDVLKSAFINPSLSVEINCEHAPEICYLYFRAFSAAFVANFKFSSNREIAQQEFAGLLHSWLENTRSRKVAEEQNETSGFNAKGAHLSTLEDAERADYDNELEDRRQRLALRSFLEILTQHLKPFSAPSIFPHSEPEIKLKTFHRGHKKSAKIRVLGHDDVVGVCEGCKVSIFTKDPRLVIESEGYRHEMYVEYLQKTIEAFDQSGLTYYVYEMTYDDYKLATEVAVAREVKLENAVLSCSFGTKVYFFAEQNSVVFDFGGDLDDKNAVGFVLSQAERESLRVQLKSLVDKGQVEIIENLPFSSVRERFQD